MLLTQKSELPDLLAVDLSCFHCINSGGVYAAVTENIGKANYILVRGVIGSCKQVSKVMGKDLLLRYLGFFAESLHITPYIRSIKRITVFTYEDGAAFYFLLFYILFEDFAKFSRQKRTS